MIRTLICSVSLIGALAVPALAQKAPSDIQALYTRVDKAFNAEDVKALLSVGTADFKMKQKDGTVFDKKASEAMMSQQFAMPGKMAAKTVINTCKVMGSKADITATMTVEGSMPGPDGKPHKMKQVSKTKDTLVKQGSAWKVKMVETIEESMTLDGKPFNPAAMAPPTPTSAPTKARPKH